jgi:oxygen-dependent protoporphyrinogen oxidase
VRPRANAPVAADAVVLAVPASAAARLVRDVAPGLAGQLAAIPFASTTIVQAAYAANAVGVPLEGSGHVNPRAGGRPVSACTWMSSKFEQRAPPGAVLLRAFIKGEAAAAGDDVVIRLAFDEFRETLGITRDPLWLRLDRHPESMPQYTLGHQDRVAAIETSLLELPGLYVAGQSYRGAGIPDTIGSANRAADAVLALAGYSGAAAPDEAPVTGRAGNREEHGWTG